MFAYLDYSAWSPIDPRVAEAMIPHLHEQYGNPLSFHSLGRKAAAVLNRCRESVAGFIGANPQEIIFTSGGMESNNLAVKGVLTCFENGQLLTSAVEPMSILQSAKSLEKWGFSTSLIPVDEFGRIKESNFDALFTPMTRLCSASWVVEGIGAVQPLEELAELSRAAKVQFHSDASTAAKYYPIDVQKLGIDLLTISGNALGGPPGTGALYVRESVRLQPLIEGGLQERGRRGGMENLANIVGFARACELMQTERPIRFAKLRELDSHLKRRLREIPDLIVHSDLPSRAPGLLSCRIEDVEAEALLVALDDAEIYVSADSPCAGISRKASSVLKAMGLSDEQANSTLSFSLSWQNELDDIDALMIILKAEVQRLRDLNF